MDKREMPVHVAIIMDGNGRWAKKRLQPRLFGHRAGMKALHETVQAASDMGIKILTVFAFSTENWKRSEEEVNGLMKIAVEYFRKEIQEMHEKQVQIRILGDSTPLPKEVRDAMAEGCELTKENTGLIFNIAINYGGRDELVHAVKAIVAEGMAPDEIDEAVIANHLYTAGEADPDILIRTGGECRLSNFLLWQLSYTEFFFEDILWPDFGKDTLEAIVEAYQHRERRYGGVKEES